MEAVEVNNGLVFFIPENPLLPASQLIAFVVGILWSGAFFVMVVNVPLQFLYRFNVFCLNRRLRPLHFFALYFLVLTLVAFVPSVGAAYVSEGKSEEYVEELKKNPIYAHNPPPMFCVGNGTRGLYLPLMIYVLVAIVCCYFFAYVAAARIWKKLREQRDHRLSSSTIAGQRRLNSIMMLQVAYPLLMTLFPMVLAGVQTILQVNVSSPFLGTTMTFLLTLLPVLNPLSVVLLTPQYRTAFFACRPLTSVESLSESEVEKRRKSALPQSQLVEPPAG
ncbi:hypothetical protein M3Y99_01113700 [Aphelenchoides fujianensis]|nr:hypothetical protein M3Y99_01113700 [Aphelenchoides fujianensis]